MGIVAIVAALVLVIAAADALAGGGSLSPPPGLVFTPSSEINATLVLDPHGKLTDGSLFAATKTTTGRSGSIVLHRVGVGSVSASFEIPLITPTFLSWSRGCDPTMTDVRFVNTNPSNNDEGNYAPLQNFIPNSVLRQLFLQIGVVVSAALDPGISKVHSQACFKVPPPDNTQAGPGLLLLDTSIGFWTSDPNVPIPK
jgi:hypothetical protein